MPRNLLIFGFGFSGEAIAEQARPFCDVICGTSRSVEKVAQIRAEGFAAEMFDGITIPPELEHQMADATHLLVSIAPGDHDPVLGAIGDRLAKLCPKLEWIGYLSTVGVYGNHDGEWVDEETSPKPVSKRSIQRVNAEDAWIRLAQKHALPISVFRLSGIYGPGRNAFATIIKGKSRRLVKPGQVFNRIHRDDIGKAVNLAMQKGASGIFNITDNEPAPPQDVVTFAHELMGIEPPPEIDFETADLTPMARSFYGENKRVSNQKSKTVLGMVYDWPDYRVSLKRMWDEKSWQ